MCQLLLCVFSCNVLVLTTTFPEWKHSAFLVTMAPKATLKRPAAAHVQAEAKKVMKKPSAGGTISTFVEEVEDNQLALYESRDKGKAEKMSKMIKNGSLPPEIVHLWEIESKKQPSERAFKTHLVNSLFSKQPDGSYRLDTEGHIFKQAKKTYSAHIAKAKDESWPKGIMIASYFHGDEKLFQKSVDAGELQSHIDEASGLEYFGFKKLSTTDLRGNEQSENVEGNKKLGKEQAYGLVALMDKLKWDIKLSKAWLP